MTEAGESIEVAKINARVECMKLAFANIWRTNSTNHHDALALFVILCNDIFQDFNKNITSGATIEIPLSSDNAESETNAPAPVTKKKR